MGIILIIAAPIALCGAIALGVCSHKSSASFDAKQLEQRAAAAQAVIQTEFNHAAAKIVQETTRYRSIDNGNWR